MKYILLPLFTVMTLTNSYSQSCTSGFTGTVPTDSNNVLIWADEFDDDGVICSDNWHFQTQCLPGQLFCWANNELQHYTDREDNAFVDDGVLKIVARREDFSDQGLDLDYTSARLNSKFAFTYGRVDVRAKLPSELGTWPAIWMLGKNISEAGAFFEEEFGTTPWPATGEIDIMEQFGRNSTEKTEVHGTTHTPAGFGGGANGGKTTLATSTTDFHIYSIIWDEEEIQFLVDDVEYYTYNPVTIYGTRNTSNWPFDKPQFLILNIAMGGVLGGDVPGDFVDATMEIDYVRVFQNYDEDTSDNLSVPLVAAPSPLKDAGDVISVFSDSYSNISDVSFDNSERTAYSDLIEIENNSTIRYINVNKQVIDFTLNSQDLTAQNNINLDYWTPNSDQLIVTIVDQSGNEAVFEVVPEVEQWVSLNVSIDEFDGDINITEITQIKLDGNGFVYVDNVYFFVEAIDLLEQTITFDPVEDISIDAGSFELVATASSGLEVEFSSFSTELEINGSTVTLLSPGTVVVEAEQPGNEEYAAAEAVSQVFCVNPSQPVITETEDSSGIMLQSSSDVGNRWYLNGNLISDQQEQTLSIDENGVYSLQVTVEGCFSPFSEEVPVVITGITNSIKSMKIYPNPVASAIQLDLSSNDHDITLVSLTGKEYPIQFMLENGRCYANVESLPSGIYIITVSHKTRMEQIRMIKE